MGWIVLSCAGEVCCKRVCVFVQLRDTADREEEDIATEAMNNSSSWLESSITDSFQAGFSFTDTFDP